MGQDADIIRRLMTKNYDLGEVKWIREVSGGYSNTSYAVWMVNGDQNSQYLLRLYNPAAVKNEILFEHALLNHLKSNGFTRTAAVIECRNKETLVQTPPPHGHRGTVAYWALFEFLDGEDRYSWTNTDLTDSELVSAAEIFSRLHRCGHGFEKPPGAERAQPRIMEFLPTFRDRISAYLDKAGHRRSDRLLKNHFSLIDETIRYAQCFNVGFQGMPEMPIHGDYHPGNLKFTGEKVVGVFDFDWSKIDYRLFDVALALVYFASLWDDRPAGFRPEKFSIFLGAYHRACLRLTHINPLTEQEQRYLVPMLAIAGLYLLNWELVEFYESPGSDDDEYFIFIDHTIGLIKWLRSNKDELEIWVENSLNQVDS
jgi:homoserine kinase type II